MQVLTKVDQPTTPTYSLISPPITPTSSKDLMHIITKLLQQGQESAQLIRNFLNERLGFKVEDNQADLDLDYHSLVALNSFKDALTFAKSFGFVEEDDVNRKRKVDIQSLDHCNGDDDTSRGIISKEKRGCYKRRRTGETWSKEVTTLVDDGHAWRKYGQKEILNTKFPRNYYRCTHKYDQHCQATKQVQQISENPTKYKIIYNDHHTCKNLHKNSQIIIDTEQNSSYFLNFETNNYPTVKNDLNNLFPTSTPTSTMVKQEELPISPSGPHDLDHQCSSSSENLPTSSDITSSTPVSDQGDSYEFGYGYDEDDIFNLIDLDNTQFQLDDILN